MSNERHVLKTVDIKQTTLTFAYKKEKKRKKKKAQRGDD